MTGTKAALAITSTLSVSSIPTTSIKIGIQPRAGIWATAVNSGLA